MKKIILTLLAISISFLTFGQLTVTTGQTGQELGEILAGDNIQVTNASISGNGAQHGAFTFSGNNLEVNSGVILSSGNVFDAIGPNNSGQTSTGFGGAGNSLLSQLAQSQTHDATVLQFDFEVQSDEIEFNFIFLSEEYNEWVGSGFNDVFAFYISGPGIDGEENLAVVPGTTTPVSINTINNDNFWQFYHDNTNGNTNIEFDGFTTLMKAKKSGLQPCNTYTLKLMIADAGDDIYDAAVLLQENSLIQPNVSAGTNTYSNNDIALEGCIDADFNFELDRAVDYDVQIPITFAGTAINGVDYKYIDPMITIPAGQTKGSIIIQSYSDGMTEGQESIKLIYSPGSCQQQDTVSLYIDDFQPIEFNATTTGANCNGAEDGEVLFSITGGFEPYLINLTDTLTGESNSYSTNPIENLPASTYLVEITDSYGCKAEDIVFGDIFNAGTTFLPTGTGVTYETSIEVTGFDDGETLETIDQFKQISATMEHSYANDLSITLRAPNGTEVLLKAEGDGYVGSNPNNSCDMGEPVASGIVDEWNADNITPGVGYQYVWNLDPVYGTMTDMVDNQLLPEHTYISTFGNELTDYYYPSGSYQPEGNLSDFIGTELNGTWTIIVTDFYILDNGYIFEWSLSLSSPQSDSIITIIQPEQPVISSSFNNPDCGSANGDIDITVTGDQTPYTYEWNTGATTQDLNNISSGTYTVNISGADGCVYDYSFNLSDNGNLLLTSVIEPETCVDSDNGSIDLTVDGGTPGFTYLWNNGASTEDISNLVPGDYTVSVTDDGGCTGIETFTVPAAIPISINGVITDENCNDREGAIDLTISGGVSPYNFVWSTGETTEDITELQQGEYTVTVSDANGCTNQKTFTVINYLGNCIPDCDLEITNSLIADENCGQSDGSIDLTVFTSFSPYIIDWSNGATTDDISGLSANTYTVSITDAEGCELTQDFIITNQTSGLEIININSTNETCGNNQGAIDLTVNGGALPYSFDWSNGASTEDLSNLSDGDYSVIITDANGCSVSDNITIINDAGDLHQTWDYVVNETCGNSEGSIDILVEGGNPFWNGYHYLWSNGSTTKGIQNLNAGDYFCEITDQNGCQITTPTYTVNNEGGTIKIDYIDVDNEICGNGLGNIELEISGGTLPYSFNWSNGETTQDIFNLSQGTYSNIISDANGCSISTGNINVINESGTLALDNIDKTNELCNNNLGSIDITINGGTQPYNYIWNTGSTSEDLVGIDAGNYSCTITDQSGCVVSLNTTIINDNGAIAVENIVTTDETCGNANGAVDLTISGAVAPISFNWNNGYTTEDISNLSAGNYSVLVTDNIGCQVSANTTVYNETGNLNLNNSILTNEQCGGANGSIDLIISGGANPISYNWSNGATTEDLTGLSAGTYSCEITDNSGCTIFAGPYTINNTSSSMFVSDALITDATCGSNNGSINITLNGGDTPISYLWTNGATTEDLLDISAGNYSVTITDNSGCSINKDYQVQNTGGDLQIVSFITTNEICGNTNGSIDINVNGSLPISYNWSNGATTQDISGISAGIYNVVITDNNGCEITSSNFNILDEAGAFTLTSKDISDEFCNNGLGAIQIEVENGTQPITYNWSNGATSQDINNLNQGTYSCLAVDANGCELNISGTVHNLVGDLALVSADITDETCGDINGAIDITVDGTNLPFDYLWSNGATTEDIANVNSGNYSCTITDSEGCHILVNKTIEDISGNFAIINSDVTDEYCENQTGAINITVSGGQDPYIYSWSNGANTEDLSNLSFGTYDVVITDNIGCDIESSFTIQNIASTLNIDDVQITDEMCGNGEGAIDISLSGANGNPFYNWDNGETTEDLTGLSSGYYEVVITDEYGCSITESYFIDNNTGGFIIQDANVVNENCGDNNGSIDLTLTGGQTPYTFIWNNGETTEDLTNIDAGDYSCIITDANNCSITYSVAIENITNGTTVSLNSITNDQCASSVGSIDITPTGGNSPYSFLWNTGATTEDLANISAGNYFVTVTDNSGCSYSSENFTVTNSDSNVEIVNIQVQNDQCGSGAPIGAIDFEASIPGSYTYLLNDVPGTPPFTNLEGGIYTISILDGNCRIDQTIELGTDGWYEVNVEQIDNETCGSENGNIDITITDGGWVANYVFDWSNGATTEDLINIPAGSYSCTINDKWGCTQTIYADVENITNFSTSIEYSEASCGEDNGAINLTIEPAGTYFFNWNNGATTEDISNLSPGTYSCTVSDTEGCEEDIIEEITNQQNILNISENIQNDICDQANGSITLTISNAPLGYSVLWDNNETTNFINNLNAGSYGVTITDIEFGCEQTENYSVDNEFSFTVDKTITNSTCETCADGQIDLILTPSAGNYTFDWSNGDISEDIFNLLPGEYTVTISDDLGCSLDSTYVVNFMLALNQLNGYSIIVYPNPADDLLNIKYDFIENSNAEFTIYDTKGQVVNQFETNKTEGLKTINIEDLASGIYFIKVNFEENTTTLKFIKK